MCWQIKPWLPSRSLSPPAERRGCLHQAGPAGPAPFTEDRLEALLAHHWDRFGTLLKSHKACFKSSLCETRSFSLPWAFQQLGAFNYSFSGLLYLPSSVCVGGMGWGRGGSGGGGGDSGAGGYNMSSEHLGLRVGPVDIGTIPGEQTRTQQALCQRGFCSSWGEVAGERMCFHCGLLDGWMGWWLPSRELMN